MGDPWRRAAIVAALACSSACAASGEPAQTSHTEVRELGQVPLTQTFVPRGDRLDRVSVLVATHEVAAPDGTLCVRIEGAGTTRDAVCRAGASLVDNQWTTLSFEPIAGAAGVTFSASFTYDGRDRVSLYANPNDPYRDGELTPGPGDLAFEVGHAGRVVEGARALGRVAREFGGRLGGDPVFTALWLLALAATAAAALRTRRRRGDRQVGDAPAAETVARDGERDREEGERGDDVDGPAEVHDAGRPVT